MMTKTDDQLVTRLLGEYVGARHQWERVVNGLPMGGEHVDHVAVRATLRQLENEMQSLEHQLARLGFDVKTDPF